MGDRAVRRTKFGKGFQALGFATAVLIKRMSGNGDLESSQQRTGVPEGTARVSIVARNLSFLTEIIGASVPNTEKAQNVGQIRKRPGVDLSSSGVNFLAFLP